MSIAIAGASLLVLVAAGAATWRLRNPISALVLASVSGIWLIANKSIEGSVLLPIDRHHGLTFADLLGFVGDTLR